MCSLYFWPFSFYWSPWAETIWCYFSASAFFFNTPQAKLASIQGMLPFFAYYFSTHIIFAVALKKKKPKNQTLNLLQSQAQYIQGSFIIHSHFQEKIEPEYCVLWASSRSAASEQWRRPASLSSYWRSPFILTPPFASLAEIIHGAYWIQIKPNGFKNYY